MVAEYLNKNIECYKKIKQYESILLELAELITIGEDELEAKDESIVIAKEVTIETCLKDHADMYNFTDYSDPKYFAEKMSLYKAECNVCKKITREQKISINTPAKVGSSHGNIRCNICICYDCGITIMMNMDTRKRKRWTAEE
jgi:hypothetical protein